MDIYTFITNFFYIIALLVFSSYHFFPNMLQGFTCQDFYVCAHGCMYSFPMLIVFFLIMCSGLPSSHLLNLILALSWPARYSITIEFVATQDAHVFHSRDYLIYGNLESQCFQIFVYKDHGS